MAKTETRDELCKSLRAIISATNAAPGEVARELGQRLATIERIALNALAEATKGE